MTASQWSGQWSGPASAPVDDEVDHDVDDEVDTGAEGISLADSPRLAQALAALDAVRDAPPAEQIAPLADAQRVLRDTLDSVGDV